MNTLKIIPILLSLTALAACSSGPVVEAKNHMAEMTDLARNGGLPAMHQYFDANKRLGQNAEGKSEQLLKLDSNGWGYNWKQIEEKYNNYNRPILKRIENCKGLKPARRQIECLADKDLCLMGARRDDESCYIKSDDVYSMESADKIPQLGWRNTAVLSQYRDALAASIASTNSEMKSQTQAQQQGQAKWQKLCRSRKYGMVLQSTILPINRFQGNTFWAKTVGVTPYASWLCSDEAQSKKVNYMQCPDDPHSSCAVVDGLPKDIQVNNYFNAVIYFAGTVKGKSGLGFSQDQVPLWRIIPKEVIKSFGIND